MAIALAKYAMFGFMLHDGDGEAGFNKDVADSGWVWCPMPEDPTFKWNPNATLVDQADRNHWEHLQYSRGEWYAGGVTIHLCPGAATDLLEWIQTRDTENQAQWASVYLYHPNEEDNPIAVKNVKVISAEFPFERGEPVRVRLELVGLHDLDAASKPAVATDFDMDDMTIVAPYIWKDITFQYKAPGGALAKNYDIKDGTIRIDNSVDDPEEGLRFDGENNPYGNPYRMYNNSGIRCTGNFSRDYIDETVYKAFRDQLRADDWHDNDTYAAGLRVEITRGTTLRLNIPRLVFNDHDHGIRGSRVGTQQESVEWIELGDHTVTPAAAEYPIYLTIPA